MSSFIPAVVSAVLLLQFGRGEETDTYWFFNCTSTLAFPLYDCAGQTFEISEDTIPDGMDKVRIDCRKATGSGCEGAKFIINDVPVSGTIDCFGYPSACKDAELLLVDVDVDDFESNRYLRCGKNGDYSCEGLDLTLVSSHLLVDCPYPHTCRNMVATLYDNSTITFMAQESRLQNNPAPKIYLYDGSECFLGSGNGVDWTDLEIYWDTTSTSETPTTTAERQLLSSTKLPTAIESTSAKPQSTQRSTEWPTTVESTNGNPQSTQRSTELTTFSTKKPTATVLQTMTPTANRTTTNILPTVSSKRSTTVVIMATNTTESGIEESDDSSTGRRQVLSARMWLFFCGVFCLSTVGCTFIWTKYKRNQRIATELMLRKLAIRSESERILRHKDIVKRDVLNRLSRVSAAVALKPSSEIPAIAPFNDEVVAAKNATEMAVMSSKVDTPSSIPRSAEELSSSNERNSESEDVAQGLAEMGGAKMRPFMFAKAGEMSTELATTTTLSSQFYNEVEGAVAGDMRDTAFYARAVAHSVDDEVKGDSEALYAGVSISSNGAALSGLCPTSSQMSEGPSSGLAALRMADIERGLMGGSEVVSAAADGSLGSDAFWREPKMMPPMAPPFEMHSERRSGGCSTIQEEPGKMISKRRKRKQSKCKRRRKSKKAAAVDLSLLEASAEQRTEWTHSQWEQYYRAYAYKYPVAYRQSITSMDACFSPSPAPVFESQL